MIARRSFKMLKLLLGLTCILHTAHAQDFPSRPVHIVTAEPGGINDVTARLIAQRTSASMGQPVIVENRAGGLVAISAVAKARPDGHTVLIFNNSMWTLPLIRTTNYDPIKDFSPITLAVSGPNVLVVPASSTVRSVAELISLAKAKPGVLNYASGSTGGSAHLAAELFKNMTGTDIMRIPYKGGAKANGALISGEVQMMFATAGSVMPLIKSGKLRGLAVTSAEPSTLTPELPTVASFLPGYLSVAPVAMFAPAGTPAHAISRLNQEIIKALKSPEATARLLSLGVDVVASSPEQLTSTIRAEMTRLRKVVEDARIRID